MESEYIKDLKLKYQLWYKTIFILFYISFFTLNENIKSSYLLIYIYITIFPVMLKSLSIKRRVEVLIEDYIVENNINLRWYQKILIAERNVNFNNNKIQELNKYYKRYLALTLKEFIFLPILMFIIFLV